VTARTRSWRRGLRLGGALSALALVSAACGDDASTGVATTRAPDAADTSVLGERDPATGEPIKVGFAYDAGGEASDTSEYLVAATATEKYINEHLGGIEGRPLEISFCETKFSAAAATECVNQFVQDGVSAVLVGATGFGEVIATAVTAAKIPYVAFLGATVPELTSPGAFSLSGSAMSLLLGPAPFMKEHGLTRLAILSIDVPTATQGVELLATPAYEAAGMEVQLVAVPPGTADMSANVSTAADAEAWLLLGDAAFCNTALQALQTQAPDKPIFVSLQCVNTANAKSLPNGYEGVVGISSTRLDPADPEYAIFQAILTKYVTEDLAQSAPGFLADGFTVVLAFARMLDGYTGDGSAASVQAQLASASALMPLGGGIEITCGRSPVPLLSALCSLGAWTTDFDASGAPIAFAMIDVAPYVTIG